MEKIKVQEHFEQQVREYEKLMIRLVPYYKEQHEIIQSLLPDDIHKEYRVLDLGCGDGILSELILKRLPNASVVGFDITDGMLESFKNKISKITSNFKTIRGDYKTESFGTGYDIIVSGMTLHHLTFNERQIFYSKLFESMNTKGVYISNDIIVDEDPKVKEEQYSFWKSFMESNGEDPEFWYSKHMEKDHPVTISQQLEWLRLSGFSEVACYWRFCNFCITRGRKT